VKSRPEHVVVVHADRNVFDAIAAVLNDCGYRVTWAADWVQLDRTSIRDPGDAYMIGELPDWAADDIAQEMEHRSKPAPAIVWLDKIREPAILVPALRAELEKRWNP